MNPLLSRRSSGSSSFGKTARLWGKNCYPVCAEMTWRRLIATVTVRQWIPHTGELNLEARQYGVGTSGRVEHVLCFGSDNTVGRQLDHPDRRI